MSRLLAITIAVALLISLAGCSSGFFNVTGRPMQEGEKTARVEIKNVGLSWSGSDDWCVNNVEFSGADGYKGNWTAPGFGACSLAEGSFYLPTGNFHLSIYMDHPSNWDIRETPYHVTIRFIGSVEIEEIDVEIKEGKEYIISPRGFYSLEEWRNHGRPKKRKSRFDSFDVYP